MYTYRSGSTTQTRTFSILLITNNACARANAAKHSALPGSIMAACTEQKSEGARALGEESVQALLNLRKEKISYNEAGQCTGWEWNIWQTQNKGKEEISNMIKICVKTVFLCPDFHKKIKCDEKNVRYKLFYRIFHCFKIQPEPNLIENDILRIPVKSQIKVCRFGC